ncbi:MAG: O-antigen ligase family protein, partial [Caldilineaceae bacterium]
MESPPRTSAESAPILPVFRFGLQESLWLLLVLTTPLFVNFWVEQQFEASKVWLLRTLIWLSLLVWLREWLTGSQRRPLTPAIRVSAIRRWAVALGLVLLLSTLLSTNPSIAFFGTLDRAGGLLTQISYLLLFACVATRIDVPTSRQLVQVAVLTAFPICLLALAQAAGWQPFPVITDARSPLTTTLGRANFTGAYLALLLPLTLAAAQSAQSRPQRGVYAALLLLELAVIGLTQARAAWIAGAAGLAVLLWLQAAPRWSRSVRWLTGLAGLLTGIGGLLFVLQRGIASGGSIAARWTIWQASLRLLWPRLWLGYGADTLDLHFPAVYPPQLVYYQGRGVAVDRAHNWLLDWSLSYGVVATLLLSGLIFLVLRQGWQQWANSGQPHENYWLAGALAASCAQLMGNLFLFEVAATGLLFWLLLAIVAAAPAPSVPRSLPS